MDGTTLNGASVSLNNPHVQGSAVQRCKIKLPLVEGGVPQSRGGDGEGRSICSVHSVQSSVVVKERGEMHPARASVLMRLTPAELSPPLRSPCV